MKNIHENRFLTKEGIMDKLLKGNYEKECKLEDVYGKISSNDFINLMKIYLKSDFDKFFTECKSISDSEENFKIVFLEGGYDKPLIDVVKFEGEIKKAKNIGKIWYRIVPREFLYDILGVFVECFNVDHTVYFDLINQFVNDMLMNETYMFFGEKVEIMNFNKCINKNPLIALYVLFRVKYKICAKLPCLINLKLHNVI